MTSKSHLVSVFRQFFPAKRPVRRRGLEKSRCPRTSESLEVRQLLVAPILLNSNPGAPVNLVIDVDGHIESDADWVNFRDDGQTGDVVTVPFDLDGDTSTFSAEEIRQIEEIWYRVAEDYAPFDVNVTTVQPASINNFEAVRIVVGGDGDWAPPAGGWGQLNGFNNGSSNTAFVFSELFNNPHDIASAVSHEAGHEFGLNHHSTWNADGTKNQEYNPGNANRAPIMGTGYTTQRDVWDNSAGNAAADQFQDDLAVLTGARNRTFKFRTDLQGNTTATAFNIPGAGAVISQTGVIEQNNDSDFYRFETAAGPISFTAEGLNLQTIYNDQTLTYGTNLDVVLRLYDSAGTLIASDNPATSLFGTVSADVAEGIYFVEVAGTGQYGAIGQYTLTGDVIPLPSTPTMISPTGTIADLKPVFQWSTGANAATYELGVQRKVGKFRSFYKATEDTTTNISTKSFIEGDYRARVRTVTTDGRKSAWSDYILFTVDVPTPATPSIVRPKGLVRDSFPEFEWTATGGAARYELRVTRLDTGERVINRTNYGRTIYQHFRPLADARYNVIVRAGNSVNEFSPWSDPVTITVKAPVPTAPRLKAPLGKTTSTNPRFVWTEVTGTAWYDLKVDYLSGGENNFIRRARLPRTSTFFDPPYMPQGNYKAFVRSINGNGQVGPWSAARSFTVNVLPPDAPVVTAPRGANGSSTIATTNPLFKWTRPDRAAKFELLVNNLSTQTAGVISVVNITDTFYKSVGNLAQGDYRVWVRGVNDADEVGDWSAPFDFSIDEPTPSTPTITAPGLNSLGYLENANPTFRWVTRPRAASYEFKLYNVSLRKIAISVSGLKSQRYIVKANERLGEYTYTARVRSVNGSGDTSDWSKPYSIRVNVPDATTPILIGPGDTISDTTPLFSWVHTSTSFRYELLVRDLVSNEDIVLQVTSFQLSAGGGVANYTLPDNKALRPSTYRFWVRAFNSQGQSSAWSTSKTFVISAQLDDSLIPPEELADQDRILFARLNASEMATDRAPTSELPAETPAEVLPVPVTPGAQSTPLPQIVAPEETDGMLAMIDAVMQRVASPEGSIDLSEFNS